MKKTITLTVACCAMFAATTVFSQGAHYAAVTQGAKAVALGSSFAAGTGIANQLGRCGRSDHNYSNIVAAELGLILTDVSCNGATTADIVNTPQNGASPQIDAFSRDMALVTITIGGNDIRYTSSTFACAGKSSAKQCTANLDQAGINAALKQLPTDLIACSMRLRSKRQKRL